MPNIPKVDGNFELEVTNATQSYEDTLYTDNKNISGNIHIHITAKSGILNNTPTSGITYTEDTSQQSVLPSEGALYLNEGYYQNTKITLDHMLPDPSGTYTNPGTNDIRAGRKAYDGTGKLIIGTMADITPGFSGGTPSLTNTTNTITTNMATASSGTYKIEAVAKAKATRTKVSYNNDYTGYLDKASGTEASAATTSAEGSINATTIYIKDASPSAEVSSLSVPTVAISGAVTGMATASSGSYYIEVNATKTDGSVKAKYKNTQEGYAPAITGSESGASAITPSITGSGTKIYIKSGAQGTPIATKGTVSNNQVTITPKVTNTEGYISGGTTYGAAITVTASELVSGTLTPTSSGIKDVTNYASVNISVGTAGTPVATKGTVSNNQVTITPKVTNSAGWISTGTISGTGVTVSASELVSGSETITSNTTGYDVTNLASIDVAVPQPSGSISITNFGSTTVTNYEYADLPSPKYTIKNIANSVYTSTGITTSTNLTKTFSNIIVGLKAIVTYSSKSSSSPYSYTIDNYDSTKRNLYIMPLFGSQSFRITAGSTTKTTQYLDNGNKVLRIQYWYVRSGYSGNYHYTYYMQVWTSTNRGSSWSLLGTYNGSQDQSMYIACYPYSGTNSYPYMFIVYAGGDGTADDIG